MAIFFCFLNQVFQLMPISRSCIVELISLCLFKSCIEVFQSFFIKAVTYKKYVFSFRIKSFILIKSKSCSFRIFCLSISFKTGTLLGKNFIILMTFSWNLSIFLNTVPWYQACQWDPCDCACAGRYTHKSICQHDWLHRQHNKFYWKLHRQKFLFFWRLKRVFLSFLSVIRNVK